MGYDCTLHLVDEKAIREEFVPRLLRRTDQETALDRVVDEAAELWETVRKGLGDEEPETAASLLCQLALKFSACTLPHQYERGFALCLWQDQEKDIAVDYPYELAFSPEALFTEVVEKYPKLHGQFPTWFTGNYSTGVFIPADRVKEVLDWVEKKIENVAKDDRRHFKGLLGILRAAASKHLAYWEATDLAVPFVSQAAGDPSLMLASFLGNEPGTPSKQVEEAPLLGHFRSLGCLILDGWLVSGDYSPFETNFWNLCVWPPTREQSLPEFAPDVAHCRDGRWLLFSETNAKASPRNFRPRLFSRLLNKSEGEYPVMAEGAELSISAGGFVGDRPIVFRDRPANVKVGDLLPPPLWLESREPAGKSFLSYLFGNRTRRSQRDWKAMPGLPSVEARHSVAQGFVERLVIGIVNLVDGNDVVVWGGDGYELSGDRFEKTFPMNAREAESCWTFAPTGTDGYFYLSNRCLFEIHRHGKATAHAEKWTNIMYVRPGPQGSILLKEGTNKDGDVAKLYFPAEGTFSHIEPELFDDKDYPFIHWSEKTDRFIVIAGKFLAVPTAAVLSLPRYRVSTGDRVKE
jgi:hypothetical protein